MADQEVDGPVPSDDDAGKWDFTFDQDRRRAIVEEARAKTRWIVHLVWAAALAAMVIAGSLANSPLVQLKFNANTTAHVKPADGP